MRPDIKQAIVVIMALCHFLLPTCAIADVVTDQLGRKVEISGNPQRVVAFAPSIVEIIYALGQGHRLKGATVFSNYPPAARKLPRIGTYVHLDLERIVALRPDLCIATRDGNPRAVIDRLTSLKIPVFVVDPRDLYTVAQTISEIGSILHASEAAERIVNNLLFRVQQVRNLVAGVTNRPLVFFQIGVKPIISVGTDTFIHELIELAGGRNAAAGPIAYPRYSREQVIGLSPEVIIVTTMEQQAVFEKVKKDWQQWKHLPAAKHNRIYLVDSDVFDRPSPRLVNGLEQLVILLHPGLKEELP